MNKPFLLSPTGKDYIWGGDCLKKEFHKKLDVTPLAETWECSTHPDGPSYVRNGIYQGMKLVDVLKEHPEFLGTKHQREDGQIPILIKFIDAAKDLSVQVHPSDEYAKEHENGQLGKTEMWYVISATPDAKLVYGFNKDMTKETLKKALDEGTILEDCNIIPVKAGDSFLITSGTVHAICSGSVVAEIQESSNLTYRLYDYHRVDKNGKPRALHIEKGLAVADMKKRAIPHGSDYPVEEEAGMKDQEICECKYFRTDKVELEGTDNIPFETGKDTFQVLLCVEGEGKIYDLRFGAELFSFEKGDCIFLPAYSVPMAISGKTTLLKVIC